jgi:hypothetical protein
MAASPAIRKCFPRVEDTVKLLDYRSVGRSQFIYVKNIEISPYNYYTSATVTASATSVYTSNKIDNLQPNNGHLYLVLPTIQPEDVVTSFTTGTVAGATYVVADGDTNTRTMYIAESGSDGVITNLLARESTRVRLRMPGAVSWWGLDQLSTGQPIDWLDSSPECPNPDFMWAVTDIQQTGSIQMQFEMPAANLSATVGMIGRVRFYVGFVEYIPLTPDQVKDGPYTPIPTVPPTQGAPSLPSPGYQAMAEASYATSIRQRGY